ncbi:hypothetical protein ASD24_09690 [Paenibacillus sp. Root52]|uniref:CHASE2 domain-containing sensor protein n=1 Tax=Paenibacillus amylolyticus TaxID=1451 RepID=A0AAP5H5J7_PAEAM|nr:MULTISPECIES: hypothetical protein [Paenibacillus]KQY84056.1 hypothetical protein ASD24_09690 [Paenibacillus sp. Root52]MDR6726743.1 CHASE2 domain-containing sensor protein [Paenibacillus amylolyticus]
MSVYALSVIVVTALLLIVGKRRKSKVLLGWGVASLTLLLITMGTAFIFGFIDGFAEGMSAR